MTVRKSPSFMIYRSVWLLFGASLSCQLWAHAEHDKARFVAEHGRDSGFCDSPLRACKTIHYAVQQASKGDRVLVAEGHYQIASAEDLFDLTGQLVPVLGGYNTYDHFIDQAPQVNPTILSGVPSAYIAKLQQQGFVVVNDGFASEPARIAELQQQQAALAQSQGPTACVNGMAGVYPCKNIDLVAHIALADMSLKPGAANDIWGYTDLNSGIEYAIIGLDNGTAVFSLADAAAPKEVGAIAGSRTSWRDIKVLQYFDAGLARWQAYAYVSSEGADNLQIIDLNNVPNSVSLVSRDPATTSAHNVYISHVDYTTNTALDGKEPLLHIVGQKAVGGAFTSFGLKNPRQLSPYYPHSSGTRADYTHDAASTVISDDRANKACGRSSCTVLADFNEQSVRLWDISQLSDATRLAELTYAQASYIHSGWWSEDGQYVFIQDELDERNFALNTTLRVMQLNDLRQPVLVKEWTGPTSAIDHNGFVRGNRYYMSNYQRGTTILDISNPANPKEAGFFDSYPQSDSAAFNGVWGTYPFLPSGLIISSDINSGLFILKDQSKTNAAGVVLLSANSQQVNVGEPIVLTVKRPQGTGAVSVDWQTLNGFGVGSATLGSGRLSWAANDVSDKTIQLTAPTLSGSYAQLFVRLFNPTQGLSLGSPSYQQVTIGKATAAGGAAGFSQTSLTLNEGDGATLVRVSRSGGSAGPLTVKYMLQSGSGTVGVDMQALSGELSWADGDATDKTLQLQPMNDDAVEGDETFTLQLTAVTGAVASDKATLQIVLKDKVLNTAPKVQLQVPASVNAGAVVTLVASATDAEGDVLQYQWKQTSGTAISFTTPTATSTNFTAPTTGGVLGFALTVTDAKGLASTVNFEVTVVAQALPQAESKSGGGGSWSWLWLGGLAMLAAARLTIRRSRTINN